MKENKALSINWWLIATTCFLLIISFGYRSGFGLYMKPISETYGWGREILSTAIAIQNLFWGITSVFAGALADRYGNVRVVIAGILFYALGISLIPLSDNPLLLNTTMGIFIGTGIGGTSFGIILPALVRAVPVEKRQWILGVGTAAASMGQFLLVPVVSQLINRFTWTTSLYLMAISCLMMIFLALPLAPFSGKAEALKTNNQQGLLEALREALFHPSYVLLVLGFFVCGFQLGFITAHVPAYVSDQGLPSQVGAWSIALIGLFNVIGSYLAGIGSGKFFKKKMLAWIYLSRSVVIAFFLFTPISTLTVILFSIPMGLLWLATVPPTSGLVATMFGTRYMATLYGIVFLNHQIGSFLGVWLGGWLYDQTGSYDWVWQISILLGVLASVIHLPIIEKPFKSIPSPTT